MHRYALLFFMTLTGCAYDNVEELAGPKVPCTTPEQVSYSLNVSPVLDRNCRSCHASVLRSGNFNMDDMNELQIRARSGLLMHVVNHDPGYPQMPQGGAKLSDCDIALLQKWVDAGAPNN
ncbi:cytochrome c [Solirubrum puertoriconensis]|nr:cytochrome c [Solirubrum puertoriconensis]